MRKEIIITLVILLFTSASFSQSIKPLTNTEELSELKNSTIGKVTLFNFWATWCGPCVHEFPDLMKLYNDYKDKGFQIVFISLDMPEKVKPKVEPFLEKNGVDFTTFYSDFRNPEDLINFFDEKWEGAIPSTYIYDKEGNLVTKLIGSRDYVFFESQITPYLDTK